MINEVPIPHKEGVKVGENKHSDQNPDLQTLSTLFFPETLPLPLR